MLKYAINLIIYNQNSKLHLHMNSQQLKISH